MSRFFNSLQIAFPLDYNDEMLFPISCFNIIDDVYVIMVVYYVIYN